MPPTSLSRPAIETSIRCRVPAWTSLRADAETIARWRKQPLTIQGEKFAASFLKNSEDQTVVGLQAVLHALEQHGWRDRSFADWGVIAAPSMFGRIGLAQTLCRMKQEGAWGVTPHLIPHQSLHGLSGTISQALRMHGPNFGVSGAPFPWADALLLAGALMMDGALPGLWVVLTGHEAEWLPRADGEPSLAPVCEAVTLALTAAHGKAGLHLSIGQLGADAGTALDHLPKIELGSMTEELTRGLRGTWRLSDTYWLEISGEATS